MTQNSPPRRHEKMQDIEFKLDDDVRTHTTAFLKDYKEIVSLPLTETLVGLKYQIDNLQKTISEVDKEFRHLEAQAEVYAQLQQDEDRNLTPDETKILNSINLKKDSIQETMGKLNDTLEPLAERYKADFEKPYQDLYEKYKNIAGLDIEHDANFKPLKLSKKKQNLTKARESTDKTDTSEAGEMFSIIFTESLKPFILFAGKSRNPADILNPDDPNDPNSAKHVLGKGGFGKVKIAQDFDTGKYVSCKILSAVHINELRDKDKPKEENKLDKEIAGLTLLDQFLGVAIREGAGAESNEVKGYIFGELFYGDSLETLMDNNLEQDECLTLLKAAATSLQNLHNQNIIHRDIKLNNFIWDKEKDDVHVIDVADLIKLDENDPKIEDPDGTASFGYTAPEILEPPHIYSKQTDVFAFAMTAKLLVGAHMVTLLKSNNFKSDMSAKRLIDDYADIIKSILDPKNFPPEPELTEDVIRTKLDQILQIMSKKLKGNPVYESLKKTLLEMTKPDTEKKADSITTLIENIESISKAVPVTKKQNSESYQNSLLFWQQKENAQRNKDEQRKKKEKENEKTSNSSNSIRKNFKQ